MLIPSGLCFWECYIFLLGCGHCGACCGVYIFLVICSHCGACCEVYILLLACDHCSVLWGVHLASYLWPPWCVVGWGIHRQVICGHVCKAPKLPMHKPHLHWPRLHDLNQSRHLDQGQGILVYPVTLDKLLKEYPCPWNHPVFY